MAVELQNEAGTVIIVMRLVDSRLTCGTIDLIIQGSMGRHIWLS